MWTTESIIELRIDALEDHAYGWDAGFLGVDLLSVLN